MKIFSLLTSHIRRLIFPTLAITTTVITFFFPLIKNINLPFWDIPEGSDAVFSGVFIKTILETGWASFNPNLGAPFGTSLLDFPNADGAQLLIIKLLSLITSDSAAILNLFFILGFFSVFFSTYWVFRRLAFDVLWSTAGALIFTFVPYHFLRGTSHLFLSSYFVVPLWVWLSIEVYERGVIPETPRQTFSWISLLPLLIICGSSGVYYSFFGIFLVLISAVLASVECRSSLNLKFALKITGTTLFVQVINIAPSLWYWVQNGINSTAAQRQAIESEIYGLRITQLLLPMWGHQSQTLADFARKYHDVLRPVTEGTSAALGLISASGFILLIACIFLGRALTSNRKIILLSRLNLAAVLFSTVAGFGVLFAMLVTPQFRGLTRISIFIGFISLLGLFLWVRERYGDRATRWSGYKYFAPLLATCVVAGALYDQVPKGARPQQVTAQQMNESSQGRYRDFIQQIESRVSKGGMVYTMPFTPFPEAAPIFKEPYNSMMRPYFYSKNIRWSYGAMKGRMGEAWLKSLENLPVDERVKALSDSGFEGIYVSREAFADNGVALENELKRVTTGGPINSHDDKYAFYSLSPKTRPVITPASGFVLGKGFWPLEQNASDKWAWSSGDGIINVYNFLDTPASMMFDAKLLGINNRKLTIYLEQGNHKEKLIEKDLNTESAIPFNIKFTAKPGLNTIYFITDKASAKIATDNRLLAFRLINPVLEKTE